MGFLMVALMQALVVTPDVAALADARVMESEPARTVRELSPDDMLLFALTLDGRTVTDGLTAYGTPEEPWLPVGELARLLDLDLAVMPDEGRIEGTLGEDRRAIFIDLATRTARVGGRDVALSPSEVGVMPTDIYIRAGALAGILPIDFAVDVEALTITLRPRETLPVQARAARLRRLQGLSRPGSNAEEAVLQIDTPYRLASPPAFDAILEAVTDSRREQAVSRRYDLRFAGDLLYSNVQGYIGSDNEGVPSTARLMLERRSSEGALPFGATRMSLGDIFTPTLALGPRSVAGRGIAFSTAPLSQANLLNTIDLRGELPIGYDVELYVNDVLRSGQRTPVEGRYEFLGVALVRGVNVIRIVTYGPRGERSEVVRVVNAGGGLLPKGETAIDIGLIQQQPLLRFRGQAMEDSGIGGVGDPRLVLSVAHGLTETFSLIGGASLYSSSAGDQREMATLGVRASLWGFAVQLDAAGDQSGGLALASGASGNILGTPVYLRHSEYRDGFIDETGLTGGVDRPLVRKTVLTASRNLPLPGFSLPVSMSLMRDGFADGGTSWTATARTSTSLLRTLVSTGVDYTRDTSGTGATQERMIGTFDLSRLINFTWQLRGSLSYDLLPEARMRGASVTIDRSVGDRLAMRLGYGQSFGEMRDGTVQGGLVLRMPFGDFALTGDYATASKDWRVGLRIAFGALFDPDRRRYALTPPGPSTSASVVFRSFIDADEDGVFSPGDEPVPQVGIGGGARQSLTREDGRALVTGLSAGPTGRLQVDTGNVDRLYLATPPATIGFAPRPGQVLHIPYAMTAAGEVWARIFLRRGGEDVGISAVRVQLMREGQPALTAATEYDGSVIFSNVPAGRYLLELDPDQARSLRMRLKAPVELAVAPDGAQEIQAEIVFDRDGT
ncbi:MAG: hypothetical protein J0G94_02480 [Sphingomonadales bacterium]|nr:hypothetical protein [Sphingomonadales bacterium]